MFVTHFKEEYSKNNYKVDPNTLDLQFLRDICDADKVLSGKFDAGKYFNETTIYKKQVFLDAPNGRFEGIAGINEFAQKWLADFKAKKAEVYPVIQTIANGRICNELELWFYRTDGEVRKVPMTIFSDPIGEDKLEGMRIYFFFKFLDGAKAYRRPIFRPRFASWAEPPIMTGVVRYYYEQLHNFRSAEAIDNIVEMCTDDVHYGGYRPDADEPLFIGKEAIRKVYDGTMINCPYNNYVRFETFCDDGVTCCVEWTIVVRKEALKDGFINFAGCAMYERARDGKLYSIRINDNAGYDPGIDRNSIPDSDWFIDG
jgi:hypothetical protein